MSLKIHQLSIYNFKLIEQCDLNFDPNGKYIIIGENRDNPVTSDSNGAGKTTLLDAPLWCLFGKSVTQCKANDIIGPYDKYTKVGVTLESFGRLARIERCKGSQNYVQFTEYIEGQEAVVEYDTASKLIPKIAQFLFPFRVLDAKDTGFELAVRLLYLSGFRVDELSSVESTSAERIKVISYLFDNNSMELLKQLYEQFSKEEVSIRERLAILESNVLTETDRETLIMKLNILNDEIKKANDKIAEFKETIRIHRNNLKDILQTSESARNEIGNLSNKLVELQNSSRPLMREHAKEIQFRDNWRLKESSTKESINQLNKWFSETPTPKYSVEVCNKQVFSFDHEIKQLTREYNSIKSGLDKDFSSLEKNCPSCGQSLLLLNGELVCQTSSDFISRAESELARLKIEKDSASASLVEWKELHEFTKAYEAKRNEFGKLTKLQEQIEQQRPEYDSCIEKINKYCEDLEKITQQSQEIDTKITELSKLSYMDKIKELQTLIDQNAKFIITQNESIITNQLEIHTIGERLKLNDDSITSFKKGNGILQATMDWVQLVKKYRQHRFNVIFRTFELVANDLFGELVEGGSLKFEIVGLGEPNARFNITARLSTDTNYRELYTFSSGENRRFGVATVLAARKAISPLHSLGLLLLDEALDKLDKSGRDNLVNYLLNGDDQLFVVSHTDDISSLFSNQIVVIKEGGAVAVELR